MRSALQTAGRTLQNNQRRPFDEQEQGWQLLATLACVTTTRSRHVHVPGNLGGLLGAELEVLGALDGQLGAALARLALQAQNDLLGGLGLVSQRSSTREASEKRFQARSRIAWAARQAHTGMPRWKRLPSRHNHMPPRAEPRDAPSCGTRAWSGHRNPAACACTGGHPGRTWRPCQSCTG